MKRSVFLSLFAAGFFLFSAASLPETIRQVEIRRGLWTAFKAEIEVFFATSEGKEATCRGSLVYQRLDEKILLQCVNRKDQPVFIFKTTDREFELYLPSQRTLYKGNIFALEDSPAIESHLRAWDLYRALKPMAIPSENVKIKSEQDGLVTLLVSRVQDHQKKPARELAISKEGNIVSEIYYGLTGAPAVKIRRSEFQAIAATPSAFPHRILISGARQTAFLFKKIEFLPDIPETAFEMNLPEGTKMMVLEDKL